ncbi:MAG: aldo/keto reductase [Clostridiales bacterium]|jgi:aryl-alcohol dehydrogenase-like predicted oxidoreductase|nr:aldo/keto reductase [Clostridiales bacterium]
MKISYKKLWKMQNLTTTTLGRTNLTVTAAGLGCGGFSRAGIDKGIDHAASVVRAAYDAGVTFFDTAHAYGTQSAVGKGLSGLPRDSYALSTKFPYKSPDGCAAPEQVTAYLDNSLRELNVDYIDVWHIHALLAEDYEYAKSTLAPIMLKAKEQGKIRFLGVTEMFGRDTNHEMLPLVLNDGLFDVIMVGCNLLNPSAAETVLPLAIEKNIAVLCMFAVRKALHDRETLKRSIAKIRERGQAVDGLDETSLDFLLEYAQTLPEAAYRFARHTPGNTVTLIGTGNIDHLHENLRSIELPPLPDAALERLAELFGNVDCVSGQE